MEDINEVQLIIDTQNYSISDFLDKYSGVLDATDEEISDFWKSAQDLYSYAEHIISYK